MDFQKEVKEFAEKVNNTDTHFTLGIFSDDISDKSGTGIIVETIKPEQGTYLRFLGCSYLFKTCPFGNIPTALIELYGLAKKLVSRTVIDIQRDKLLLSVVIFYYIFRNKKFYYYLNDYTSILHRKVMGIIPPDTKRFNTLQIELRRVNEKVFENETHKLTLSLKRIFELVIYLMDFDTAYRFPAQDVLGNIQKNPPIKEFKRLCELLEERYNDAGCKRKAKQLKKLSIIFYHPYFKRLLTKFFQEINIEKVKLDEDDNYFCLKKNLYNFNGLDYETRVKQKEKIDKEKGHIKIDVDFSNVELYG